MASRVNTKLLLILFISLSVVVVGVGGLYYLAVRGNAEVNAQRGAEHLQQGEFEEAARQYRRALNKEPANLDYLAKYREALTQVRPESDQQARDSYFEWIRSLRHESVYHPNQAAAHIAMFREAHAHARALNMAELWEQLAEAAEETAIRIPQENAAVDEALLYQCIARFRLANVTLIEDLKEAEEQLQEEYLQRHPDSDLGWASLIIGQSNVARKLRSEGLTSEASAWDQKLAESITAAAARVEDGPHVAMARLVVTAMDPEASDETIEAAALNATTAIAGHDDPWLVRDAAEALRLVDAGEGLDRAHLLIDTYLEADPTAPQHRFLQAKYAYLKGNLDEATDKAQALVDAQPLPVGLMGRLQGVFKLEARALLVDAAFRKWDLATGQQRTDALEHLRTVHGQLVGIISDPETNPAGQLADGKLALAEGDYQRAAAKFDLLSRTVVVQDLETAVVAMRAFELVGELGEAHRRATLLVAQNPDSTALLHRKAHIEYRMRSYGAAEDTLAELLALNPDHALGLELKQALIDAQTAGARPLTTADDVLFEAQQELNRGETEAAHNRILAALETDPDNLQLLDAVLRIELALRELEQASQHLQHAKTLAPGVQRFRQYEAILTSEEDAAAALRTYLRSVYDDDAEFQIALANNLIALADQQTEQAAEMEAAGDAEGAQGQRDLVVRSLSEAQAALAEAEALTPEAPLLLLAQFRYAMHQESWDQARTIMARSRDVLIGLANNLLDRLFLKGIEIGVETGAWDLATEMVSEAQRTNADQIDGLHYEGRLRLARGNLRGAVTALEEASRRKPYASPVWRSLGEAYRSSGDLDDAIDAYDQAYQRNPNDPATALGYLRVLTQKDNSTRALAVARDAARRFADQRPIVEVWLGLEASLGEVGVALAQRGRRYIQSPNDTGNAIQLAVLLSTREPARELLADQEGGELFPPARWNRMTLQQRADVLAEARRNWREESATILQALEQANARDLAVLRQVADIWAARGEASRGEQVLRGLQARQVADIGAPSLDVLLSLAGYQQAIGQSAQAVATLTEAQQLQSPELREADRVLAGIHFVANRFDAALELLQQIHAADPTSQLQLQIIECLTRLYRFDEAERNLQLIVQRDGASLTTHMLAAAIARGRAEDLFYDDQIEACDAALASRDAAIEAAIAAAPADPLPYRARAENALRDFRRTGVRAHLDEASRAIARADELAMDRSASTDLRIAVHLARGDVRSATSEIRSTLSRQPQDVQRRQQLVALYLRSGDEAGAVGALREATSLFPNVSFWWQQLGDRLLLLADGPKVSEAIDAYRRMAPSPAAVGRICEAHLRNQPPAYQAVLDELATHPDWLDLDVRLRGYRARAFNGLDRRDEAIAEQRRAWSALTERIEAGEANEQEIPNWFIANRFLFDGDPSAGEQFALDVLGRDPNHWERMAIADHWAATGADGWPRAIELLTSALAQAPQSDATFRIMAFGRLSEYHLAVDDSVSAAEAMRQIVALQPNNALALNNLAYVTAVPLNDPEAADRIAKQAYRLNPGHPAILDTYGWVRFKLGDTELAERLIREAIQKDETPDKLLHLAQVLDAQGHLDPAEKSLERALELQPDPDTQAEIVRLADDIRSRMNQRP